MRPVNAIQRDGSGPFVEVDARARLPVVIDWSHWLATEGTEIASSVWEASTGLTIDGFGSTATAASTHVSGGAAGQVYTVRNTITTASGLSDSRSIRVSVKNR